MYKRKIAAAALAAFMLSGCGNIDYSESSDVSAILQSTSEMTSVSDASDTEYQTSSSEAPDESESDVSSDTESTSGSSLPENVYDEAPVSEDESVQVLTYDPQADWVMTFDGLTVTVTGKISPEGVAYATAGRDAAIDVSKDGDEFTITLDFYSGAYGFTTIKIFNDNGTRGLYRVKFSDGEVGMPDTKDVSENNLSVAANAIEQPLAQVAEYVAIGSDEDEVRETLLAVQTLSDEICAGLTDDYDKLRAIENWVSNNIAYDYPAYNKGVPDETITLKYVIENRYTVCGGYSNITAALAAAQGIRIYNVQGSGAYGIYSLEENPGEEFHEWNFAVIDGRLIWIDADFDSRSYYRGGAIESGVAIRKYFDIDTDLLAVTHRASVALHRDYFALLSDDYWET